VPSAEPKVDTAPFDLPGSNRAAALCLHGLTGTPYEVRPLGEALSQAGIRAVGPALPGHNETPQSLARVRYQQWLEAAREQLQWLRDQHDVVFVVGLSMGGLLTLALASEERVDGAVTVGTPLRLSQPLATFMPLLKYLVPLARKREGSNICDPAARLRHPSYEVMPLAAVRQLQHLQRLVRGALGRVTAPLLVAHGAHDATADPADSKEIFDRVASREREYLILEDSAHVVPVDRDGPRLAAATVGFLTRYA
jgi:carboxylesterase